MQTTICLCSYLSNIRQPCLALTLLFIHFASLTLSPLVFLAVSPKHLPDKEAIGIKVCLPTVLTICCGGQCWFSRPHFPSMFEKGKKPACRPDPTYVLSTMLVTPQNKVMKAVHLRCLITGF